MTVIFLLRHAHSEANGAGILAGQIPDIHLSKNGVKEAKIFAKNYQNFKFKRIYISPLERCRETIDPYLLAIKKNSGRIPKVIINPDFVEMDYGSWSGLKLKQLALKPLWRRVQKDPRSVTFPNGESFKSLEKRVRRGLVKISKADKNGVILVVTHGDVIKVATAIALDMEFNNFQKISIDPASITAIEIKNSKFRVLTVNSKTETFQAGGERFALGGGSGAKIRKKK